MFKTLFTLFIMTFISISVFAADPFTAPALFDFSGSKVYLEAKVTLPVVGEVDVDIDPNPVTVDAKIFVETLDSSGNWTGYGEGTGSTTATAPVVGSIPVNGEAGGSAEGYFDFANDKVTVYSDDAWALINVLGTPYSFDIDEGEVEGEFDGQYMYFYYSGSESMDIMGFTFNFEYDIEAVGELIVDNPDDLTALINTNMSDYNSGETFECYIGIDRNGPEITVDAWIVLINPANQLLFFPSFTTAVSNIPDFTIPANFEAYDVLIFSETLPGANPPIEDYGSYVIAFGLSEPGTLNFYTIGSKMFNYTE